MEVLSEVPAPWAAEVRRWRGIARRWRREVEGHAAPDDNDEYLLYQTLMGAWPARDEDETPETFTGRIAAYMEKATKEAKRRTSWINPSEPYDRAMSEFVTALLAPDSPFRPAFRPFQRWPARPGALNSLAQPLLKLTVPVVPDLYQGTELWDLSLVDPDNRRPVDYALREQALATEEPARRLQHWRDGRLKQRLIHAALAFRSEQPALF